MTKQVSDLVKDLYTIISTPKGEMDDKHFATQFTDITNPLEKLLNPVKKERKENTLYFSEVGGPCKRKLWFKINFGDGEDVQPHTRVKFAYGDILENMVLSIADAAGHTVERCQEKVTYQHPTSDWVVSGRIDAFIDGSLVDVKSVSRLGVQKFKDGLVDDPFGYKQQLNGYACVLKSTDNGFLCIEKELGHLHYFPVTGGYNTKAWETTVDLAVQAVTSDLPPPRVFEAVPQSKTSKNMKLPTQCSYCEHKKVCWADANDGGGLRGFMYSGRVEWLTQVGDTPRVPEIVEEDEVCLDLAA